MSVVHFHRSTDTYPENRTVINPLNTNMSTSEKLVERNGVCLLRVCPNSSVKNLQVTKNAVRESSDWNKQENFLSLTPAQTPGLWAPACFAHLVMEIYSALLTCCFLAPIQYRFLVTWALTSKHRTLWYSASLLIDTRWPPSLVQNSWNPKLNSSENIVFSSDVSEVETAL